MLLHKTDQVVMRSSPIIASVLLLSLSSCGKGDKGDARSLADEAQAPNTFIASNPNSQLFKASAASKILGAQVLFPAGSFAKDTEIELGDGKALSGDAVSAAPSVALAWLSGEDSLQAFTLTIPLPAVPSADQASSLTILFARKDATTASVIAADKLKKVGLSRVSFQATSPGTYQAVYAATPGVAPPPTDDPMAPETTEPFVAKPSNGALPQAFAVKTPVAGRNLGAKFTVSWEEAVGAASYEVRIDAADPACANATSVVKDIHAFKQVVDAPADGALYVCVFAVNDVGALAASNMPLAVAAERSPPNVPGKPAADGPRIATSSVTFRWAAATDVGTAGLRNYSLQVGTTPGGSDVFSADLSAPTGSFLGKNNTTYYARVRAEDGVGNVSAWSPVSDPVVVDLNEASPLAGFTAQAGGSGIVRLTLDYSNGQTYKYNEIRIYRAAGTSAPTCDGTPVKTLTSFAAPIVDDPTGSGTFSYRLCIFDKSAYLVSANTATATAGN